ncbi:unnamed protein product, partial [Iphiclides podalirius]
MMLTGDAAVWWRRVRDSVASWPEALARLRAAYGVQKPTYRVLREVFATEQGVSGKQGVAIVDTGATYSVASPLLYSLLLNSGVSFREVERVIGLADGSRHTKIVKIATVTVTVGTRNVDTEFWVFPGDETRALLGRDFIAKVGMILDIAQEVWYFADNPEKKFPFEHSYVLKDTAVLDTLSDMCDVSLRPDEGTALSSEQRAALNHLLRRRVGQFAADGGAQNQGKWE